MQTDNNRDNFSPKIVSILSKRAAYICSNPECKRSTLSPSEEDIHKVIYIGEAAHITSAAEGGPRYDETLTSEQRSSINNAIFLCSSCATMIDKNKGIDFPVELLNKWKEDHETWVRSNLNKRIEDRKTTSITSENQSGGITAGVINFK